MKKLGLVFVLSAMLMSLTLTIAWGGMGLEDPALCVAGKWLVVNAAYSKAIHISMPEGTRYGDQRQGGCTSPAPAPLLTGNVDVQQNGRGSTLKVQVDGAGASNPLTVSYGSATKTSANNGKGKLNFEFSLR